MSESQFALLMAHVQAILGCLLVLVAEAAMRLVKILLGAFVAGGVRRIEIWEDK